MRTEYKQTEVGDIPMEWNVSPLISHVKHHNSGVYKKSDQYGHGCNIVGVSDVYNIDSINGQRFAEVPLSSAEQAKHTLQANDLLYGESSLVREGIARTVHVTEQGAGTAFAWHTRRFAVHQEKLLSRYLYYYLQSHCARKHMMDHAIQTAITGINTVAYFACPVLVPPIGEQRAIAEALGDVDALLASLDRLIAKNRDIKQAVMQQLLTGKTRLPGFSDEWEPLNFAKKSLLKARIGWQGLTTAEYLSSGSHRLVTGTDFLSGKINWETCPFVSASRYHQDRNIQLRVNDVLTTKDGTIGKVAFVDVLPGPATLNSGVFVIRPKDFQYHPKFLFYILSSSVFEGFLRKLAAGSTISHLYQKDFVAFEFLAPQTVREQEEIAELLGDMDAAIGALEARRYKAGLLKQGMMQELLTGRTRLV
jgi:type I restriction enzyme S subunit